MDMVERVAKAIYEGRNGPGCVAWAHRDKGYRAPYAADAHNALRAMREPTPEMLERAWAKISADKRNKGIGRLGLGASFAEYWAAAHDAALHPMPEE